MISSIVLLFVLQAFWLTNSYEKAYFELRREANSLFRTTIFALRDSFFMRNVESIGADVEPPKGMSGDTAMMTVPEPTDGGVQNGHNGVHVYISSPPHKRNDSVSAAMLRPLVTKIQVEHLHGRNKFFIRMGADSLAPDTVKVLFKKALAKENMALDFKVKHNKIPPPAFGKGGRHRSVFRNFSEDSIDLKPNPFSNSIQCDWAHYNPLHRYSVSLTNFRLSLIKEILPQILFSFFLTVVTLFSFAMLYRSIRAQQRLMELKNDFISNMTHELKTPIATVSVALEALKNFKGIDDPRRTEEYLNMAQHELNRLTTLTENVLNTSLFEEGGAASYTTEPVDLENLIKQVLDSMTLVFEKNKTTINFIKNGNDFVIQGSLIHLTNVIYNLLDNAIKYSENAAVITITLSDYDAKKQLDVTDKGMGIAPEYASKIFEKFFRVPAGNIHTVKGYGLGLSYVRGVVMQHGGTIRVTSQPGTGSTFSIELPTTTKQ